MFRSAFYDTKKSVMHLWETINGERTYTYYDWVPYIFVRTHESEIKTLDGNPVVKKEFRNYREYYEFQKENYSIYENRVKPEIQFLAERYYKIPDDELEVPKLKIYSTDIEVNCEQGFPSTKDAKWPISIISIRDSISKKTITFGLKEYTGIKGIVYIKCDSEEDLLRKFFNFMQKYPPDVISGWNIWNFDIPYLINRSKVVFGEDTVIYKLMSPIKVVRIWQSRKEDEMNMDIAGVHILDYYNIYRWYAPVKLESYKLDFVCRHELEKGKVDYSDFVDLMELYEKDFNKFVEYNVTDAVRVDQLEDKLGYIRLIQALSLLTKCPMKFYNAMTSLVEGAMITYYRRNNLCAPFFAGGTQEPFEAAYVKEPQTGMHPWVIDIDITSSYPSHIITLNMSTETYVGRILNFTEQQIVYYTRNREFPSFTLLKEDGPKEVKGNLLKSFNTALSRGIFAISPCGSVFSTGERGVISDMEKNVFFKRKEVKGKMKDVRMKASQNSNPKEKEKLNIRGDELFSLQWALKIFLNAVFGITAVPYSRYFNTNIAEAITSCGRHTIKQGEKFVNQFFKERGYAEDFVAYIDTDSLFVKLGDYFEREMGNDWRRTSDAKKIERMLSFSKEIEEYVNDRIFNETQLIDYNSQVHDFKISFKQEIVAKTALFVRKKKYAYWCVNKEGVPSDEISVTGLEIVRSDSSEAIRGRLKHIMELILQGEDDDLIRSKIDKYKKELMDVYPEEIAANITVNNTGKYIEDDFQYRKGTPWHIKGVANYRRILNELGIRDKYEDIYDSVKAKVLYVKKNPFNVDVITFHRWPKEFENIFMVDYATMIEKFFTHKIEFLLEPMNKKELLQLDGKKNLGFFFN